MNIAQILSAPETVWRLGPGNVLGVLLYRLRCRVGAMAIDPVAIAPGDLFTSPTIHGTPAPASAAPVRCFGWKSFDDQAGLPPDWIRDPITLRRFPEPSQPWYEVPDFAHHGGDIKCIWEMSRWDWMLSFAQRYRQTRDDTFLARLNDWLRDWLEKNPPYRGPNWMSGQEVAIRVMHAAMTALILDQVREPSRALIDLVHLHLRRIEPTLSYAMAQDNNHGTSEATALFIGGSWLAALGFDEAGRWESQGRRWLENRVARLIERDGTFSQYSVNYHRLLLDTLGMAEVWRRRMGLPAFTSQWSARAEAAARWLYSMTDPTSGDAPNVGGNDGARLLPLTDTDYRDYRPTAQLSMALFAGQSAYDGRGTWSLPLSWLGIDPPSATAPEPGSCQFDDGGFALLRRVSVMAVIRYPRFRFRPSQADALHVDLWRDGLNLLRDGGTYSYHADPETLRYFSGTASHNTVQFDDRDQMQRLGRFLFGAWLKAEGVEALVDGPEATTFAAGYRDRWGARHWRRVSLEDSRLVVTDRVEGFMQKAILRWRLMPGAWRIEAGAVTNGTHTLSVESSVPVRRLELVTGWESRYYMQETDLPVLEVEIHDPGVLTTQYCWCR